MNICNNKVVITKEQYNNILSPKKFNLEYNHHNKPELVEMNVNESKKKEEELKMSFGIIKLEIVSTDPLEL